MFKGITVPKFAISQSEANSTVLISYDIKSLTWYPTITLNFGLRYDNYWPTWKTETNLTTDREQSTRSNAPIAYIGETGRNLNTRLPEHKWATRNGDANYHIAVHHQLTNHNIDWDSAQCLTYSTNYFQRLTLESWYTNPEQTNLLLIKSNNNKNKNNNKVPAFHECRVINLIIIKKETPTFGFKTSKHLCLPTDWQVSCCIVPHHYRWNCFLENWFGGVEELVCPHNS